MDPWEALFISLQNEFSKPVLYYETINEALEIFDVLQLSGTG